MDSPIIQGMEAELTAYDAIHRKPLNRLIHDIGIPVIMFSVAGATALIGQTDGFINGGMLLGLSRASSSTAITCGAGSCSLSFRGL
jgi:uncharacterized membrane protein YGL010W